MRKTVVLVALALLLVSLVGSVIAQDNGGGTIEPGLAYRFTIPDNADEEIQTSTIGQIAAHYLVPLTSDGEWNLQVIGGGGIANDLTDTMIGLGAAYAPQEVQNVMVGLAGIFDVTFPTDAFRDALLQDDEEAWLALGVEGSLDFKVGGLPGSLVAGWANGLRGKPSLAYFALKVPMQVETTEERLKRSE